MRNRSGFYRAAAVALSAVACATVFTAPSSMATSPAPLAQNGGFDEGKAHWAKVNSNTVFNVGVHNGDNVAVLSAVKRGRVGITDSPNWVESTGTDQRYFGNVNVRGTQVGTKGYFRVLELRDGEMIRAWSAPFTLTDRNWTTVYLQTSATTQGSQLDLRFVARDQKPGAKFMVDDANFYIVPPPPPQPEPYPYPEEEENPPVKEVPAPEGS